MKREIKVNTVQDGHQLSFASSIVAPDGSIVDDRGIRATDDQLQLESFQPDAPEMSDGKSTYPSSDDVEYQKGSRYFPLLGVVFSFLAGATFIGLGIHVKTDSFIALIDSVFPKGTIGVWFISFKSTTSRAFVDLGP